MNRRQRIRKAYRMGRADAKRWELSMKFGRGLFKDTFLDTMPEVTFTVYRAPQGYNT
jgi:hypothetical protein